MTIGLGLGLGFAFSALSAPVMARGPSSQLALAFAPSLAHGAVPLSICVCPTLGMRRGLTTHLPCLLYFLLLWRTACPRSERSVGGQACIALTLDFGTSRPVCKRAPRAEGRHLFYIERSRTPSLRCPRSPNCGCVALQVKEWQNLAKSAGALHVHRAKC